MSSAFSIALSALNAESSGIDVVGNNLANINTTGYKASTTEFYDLMSQSQGGNASTQVGMGVGTPDTETVFSQGTPQASQSPLAVAIEGQGFLIAQSASGNGTVYTRDGDLTTNSAGDLMTANGDYIQGWSNLNGSVSTSGAIGNIVVPTGTIKAPTQSTELSLSMNLDSTATSTYSTSQTVYDSLGNAHTVDLTFTPVAPTAPATAPTNQWTVTADLDGPNSGITAQVSGGSVSATTVPAELDFTSSGTLLTTTTTPANAAWTPLTITLGTTSGGTFTPGLPAGTPYTIGSGGDGALTLNLTDSSGNPTITQYAQTSGVSANSSDGNAAVNLTSVAIGNGGGVVATFSDGTQLTVGQLAMANFQNPDSLLNVGNNEFQASGLTSAPSIGLPNNGGRGQILGGNLEASTVDIATEFTNMLVFQQGYDANSKVVTTANQMSQDTINLIQ